MITVVSASRICSSRPSGVGSETINDSGAGHGGGGPGYLVISFTLADGNRQVTVSTKPYSGDPGPRLRALLETALCP
ncbi:hypothetical protein [Streptosporangium roseum]|uniref:hypothetical protein n=1 Tax=Streptosporangium roseum TaxID=2001 RepID=UPI0004CDB554|nr:hypothetical protein [Streptosporangium roseum]